MTPRASDRATEIGGALLFRLVRSIAAVEGGEARCCGVTLGQGLALLAVGTRKGPFHLPVRAAARTQTGVPGRVTMRVTMRGIAAAIGVSPGTATRVVDNLVRDGLAQRVEDPADRRRVCIRPTKGGEKKIAQLEECYGRFWRNVFGRIPKRKLTGALSVLGLVVEAVEDAKTACCAKRRTGRDERALRRGAATGARIARAKVGARA